MIKSTADRIRELEAEQEKLSEGMDGCDFITVCCILASSEIDEDDFYLSSIYRDLLQATQSNPNETHEALMRWREIDEEITITDEL